MSQKLVEVRRFIAKGKVHPQRARGVQALLKRVTRVRGFGAATFVGFIRQGGEYS